MTKHAIEDEYLISDAKNEIQLESVKSLLSDTYWAKDRNEADILISIENSVCFSIFYLERQIGFARVVTDYASIAYIADVKIELTHQGKGLGQWLMQTIVNDERWRSLLQILATDDAHKLYEKIGFTTSTRLMSKRA